MKNRQTTKLLAGRQEPAPTEVGLLQRPMPRAVSIPLVAVIVAIALLLLLNLPVLHVYQKHFSGTLPEIRMPWHSLSASMDEGAVRAQFPGVPFRCMAEASGLGDRVCFAAVRAADRHPALTLALFFRGNRLTLAMLHVPWWGHGRAAEALARRFGPSRSARDGEGGPLRRWQLPDGYLDMNQRRSLNPLAWSAVVWTPRAATGSE